MTTKRFCDVCEREISTSMTIEPLKESTVLRRGGRQTSVAVEISAKIGSYGVEAEGDLCKHCLFDAIDRFDPRDKAVEVTS